MNVLDRLKNGLVVSCQPVDDGPMDDPRIVAAMALAAEAGGSTGLRIEGLDNLDAMRDDAAPASADELFGDLGEAAGDDAGDDEEKKVNPFADGELDD